MPQKTSTLNLVKCKELNSKAKFKAMTINEFLKVQPAVNNRHSKRRAEKEYKKFIKPARAHLLVALAEYKKGYYNLDSNTRSYIWKQSLAGVAPYNKVPVPKKVQAFISQFDDDDSAEMEAEYYMYDNQGSVENKADKLFGIARIADMHEELRYFGDLNGFSGLPSALKHMMWNCQNQKAKDGDAGLVQLFNYFRHEWKIADDILMKYIDTNPHLSVDSTKVLRNDIPLNSFNLFNSDGKAVVIAGILAVLKKYNGTTKFDKAKKVIADLLDNTNPITYGAYSVEGHVSNPLDLVAYEFSKGEDLPLHWPSKHVPSNGVGKDPSQDITHQHSDRCAFVLYMLEAAIHGAKVNPRKLFTRMQKADKKFPPKKVEKSHRLQKELGKYERLLDKTAGWDCKILQLATYGFCLSDRPSTLAKEMYE